MRLTCCRLGMVDRTPAPQSLHLFMQGEDGQQGSERQPPQTQHLLGRAMNVFFMATAWSQVDTLKRAASQGCLLPSPLARESGFFLLLFSVCFHLLHFYLYVMAFLALRLGLYSRMVRRETGRNERKGRSQGNSLLGHPSSPEGPCQPDLFLQE